MADYPELLRLIERVPRSAPVAADLLAAVEEFRRPARIQIAGRSGVGRSTVAAALAIAGSVETDPVDHPDIPEPTLDGDAVVYVLDSLQPADRSAVSRIAAGRAIVILNKADAVDGSWASAVARANEYAAALGIATVPLVATIAASLAHKPVTTVELVEIRNLTEELQSVPDDLLQRWERWGISAAFSTVQRNPAATTRTLTQVLNAVCGVEQARAAVEALTTRAAALRGATLLDTLELLAARAGSDPARAEIENFLLTDSAAEIGLVAAWASPSLTPVIADHRLVVPTSAEQAQQIAQWWRGYARGDIGSAGRRAALRIHRGYVSTWSKLAASA
ncbi:hypothetical protein [Antrihabitans sp. YC2-6]|uniref:hypothetical protein n=1 Tax=Antrihabitans sp. YC2-6 TaxID=2799498 RepID=UPI0018F3418D|nr:hypothetical protein [Antrihabitans sp. YC2-6]MBJ8347706.1 hypothetical protein [Antrihabitans sp. YC2-6]